MLRSKCDLRLYGWCDSNWAGCTLTRCSLIGWFIFGDSPISWKTKKKHTSQSSAEAEYYSIVMTICEVKWLKEILSSLGVTCTSPIHLYCDSQAVLHIAKNPFFHKRAKYIEVDCHFMCDKIYSKNIRTSFVSSHELADIFMKAFKKSRYVSLLQVGHL